MKVFIIIILIVIIIFALVIVIKALLLNSEVKHNLDLSKEELLKLPDAEIIAAIYDRIYRLNQDNQTEKEFINSLNTSSKVIYICTTFLNEIENGGMCQYLANYSKYSAPYLECSLDEIKAYKMKNLVIDFFKHNNLDQFYYDTHEQYMKYYSIYSFDDFDSQFCKIRDEEDFYNLLANYIRNNIDSIIE